MIMPRSREIGRRRDRGADTRDMRYWEREGETNTTAQIPIRSERKVLGYQERLVRRVCSRMEFGMGGVVVDDMLRL